MIDLDWLEKLHLDCPSINLFHLILRYYDEDFVDDDNLGFSYLASCCALIFYDFSDVYFCIRDFININFDIFSCVPIITSDGVTFEVIVYA